MLRNDIDEVCRLYDNPRAFCKSLFPFPGAYDRFITDLTFYGAGNGSRNMLFCIIISPLGIKDRSLLSQRTRVQVLNSPQVLLTDCC